MLKHILMPTDGSEHSERAVERGIELAKLCGAKVTGIHVMQDYRMMLGPEGLAPSELDEGVEERERERAASFLAFVQKTADAAGVSCDTVLAKGLHPYDAIVDAANDRGCDLIVMTSRHRKGLVSLIHPEGTDQYRVDSVEVCVLGVHVMGDEERPLLPGKEAARPGSFPGCPCGSSRRRRVGRGA